MEDSGMTTWIVAGGRKYNRVERVYQILDAAVMRLNLDRLIEGGASGADALARQWRIERGIAGATYKAAWDDVYAPGAWPSRRIDGSPYNTRAGFDRNQKMLDVEKPTGLIAFPGGSGTKDMIRRAKHADVRVITIDWNYPL